MRKLINAYILFASIFFFHLIWIFQGLDGYDLGFHLNHQVAAVSLEFSNSIPSLYFLTDLVGGIWLKIINVPNLLWVRLGGILLFCLNGVISFKILTVYFDRKKVFFVIFAVTLFITGGAIRFTIEHYTFPALLVNIALLIFNQLLNQTLASRSFKIYAFLLGFMTIPIILARLPLLLIVFIPVLVLAYYVVAKKDMMELRKSAPYVIFGVATSLLVFAVFYQTIGFLDTYIVSVKTQLIASAASDVSQFSGAHYGILTLIKKYIREYIIAIMLTGIASICLYILSLLKDRWGNKIAGLTLLALTTFGCVYVVVTRESSVWAIAYILRYTNMLIMLCIGFTLLVSFTFFMTDRGRTRNLSLLVLVSNFVMIIHAIGSNNGLYKSIYGMWLALPLMFLIIYEFKGKIDNRRLKSVFSLNPAVISLLIFISVCLHFTSSYWDNPNRIKLNTAFKYKYLRYIYADKEQVDAVDETLIQINQHSERNDTVLMVRVPIQFYYLTETKPLFDFNVSQEVFRDSFAIAEMYKKAIENKRYPKLFIYSKKLPRYFAHGQDRLLAWLKEKYIDELDYKLVWENDTYVVTTQPKEIQDFGMMVNERRR